MPRSQVAKSTAKVSKSAQQAKQAAGTRTTTSRTPRGRPSKAAGQNAASTKVDHSSTPAYRRVRTVHDATRRQQDFVPDLADDEEILVPKERSMSVEYGHGRTLGPVEPDYETPNVTGSKRRRSSIASVSPSKKVRFDPDSNEIRQILNDKVRPTPVSPAVPPRPFTRMYENPEDGSLDLPDDPAQHLLNSLTAMPEPVGLQSAADLFKLLQFEVHTFSKLYFGFNKQLVKDLGGEHSRKNFPLHELEHTYPALFMTTRNLLDIPVDNPKQAWLNYFTRPAQRQALVYGILGEWISQRVFNDSTFGLSENFKKIIREEVDIPYIHYDSFVRAKKRAAVVKAAFQCEDDGLSNYAMANDSSELVDELMVVLAPLMPTWRATDPFSKNLSGSAALHRQYMAVDLLRIMIRITALHLSLIRSGENNILFRIAAKLEKGREFNALAPMDCINLEEKMKVAQENPQILDEKKLMVRMTCWARIEACVGHGLNREEMEEAQQDLVANEIANVVLDARRMSETATKKEFERAYKKFCWDCTGHEMLPELPKDLWKQQAENVEKINMKTRISKIQRQMNRQSRQQQAQEDDDDDYPSDSDAGSDGFSSDKSDSLSSSESNNVNTAENNEEETPRGAYITVVDRLVNHQVYCEWVTPVSDNHNPYIPDDIDAKGGNLSEVNSLQSIVRAARASSKSPLIKMADLQVRAWNLYASKNLWIEWASFLALVFYLSRGRSVSNMTVLIAKVKDFLSARGEDLHKVFHHVFPHLSSLEQSFEDLVKGTIECISEHDGLLQQLIKKLKEVIPMPHPINFEDELSRRAHYPVRFGSAAAFKTAITSAITAILPAFMPVAPSPPVLPEQILAHGSDATGPAIPLTLVETFATEPTPSYRARPRWW